MADATLRTSDERRDLDPTTIFTAFGDVVFPADVEAVADAILGHGGASLATTLDFTLRVERWAAELRTTLERKATVHELGEGAEPGSRPTMLGVPGRQDPAIA